MTPGEIKALLSKVSNQSNNERELQERVGKVLRDAGIAHVREAKIDGGLKLDFFLPATRTAIETKTRDGRGNVLRQLKRYADDPTIDRIMVMSRQPMSLPTQLSGKPIINLELWRNFA